MSNYCYADRNDSEEVEEIKCLLGRICTSLKQNLYWNLSVEFKYTGPCLYNLITYDDDGDSCLEFDVDIVLNTDGSYKSNDVHQRIYNSIINYRYNYGYSVYEHYDNIEIRKEGSYSCCFYIVYNCSGKYNGLQKYVKYNFDKEKWQFSNRATIFNNLDKWVIWLKENQCWNKFREDYLKQKNNNENTSSKDLFLDSVRKFYSKRSKPAPAVTASKKNKPKHDFAFVEPKISDPVRANIAELIKRVRDEVKNEFSFQDQFIGSSARNMITYDRKGNTGFDFDVNIIPQKIKGTDTPEHLRTVIFNAVQKYYKLYGFNNIENSKSVITVNKVDKKKSKILYGCDFAVVRTTKKGRQQNIILNKKNNKSSYVWEDRGDYFAGLSEREKFLKDSKKSYWNELRIYYIDKKNYNDDDNKHSRSIYAEAVKEICDKYGYKV